MGKKSKARPGLDGIAPGTVTKTSKRAARRVAREESKKGKKRLMPGTKGGKAVTNKMSAVEKLRRERENGAKDRVKRREELAAKGLLYDPSSHEEPEHPEPSYRVNVSVRKMILCYEISVHKIPVQMINVEMTDTTISVDTLKYTKKFVLKKTHPDGIKCEPDGLAEISPKNQGVLTIKLRITHLPEVVKEREEKKQKSLEEVRNLRFRRNNAGELITGVKKSAKEALTKRKREAMEEGDADADAEGKKKAKKKKTFVTDKNQALNLIESIATEEEPKKQQRKSMLDHVTDMKEERKERRAEKRAKKQTMVDAAVKHISSSKKKKQKAEADAALAAVVPLKKPTGRKVRFA
eukprot:TRINITY_DN2293_c1_g4_i1.p2 TRINITY_DN2293_c1_g4~~TRINITY_DN2293_c1_g4_i1.p2  ORF type:complete len:351 (+),score=187.17 TRINITY_DN2293_c1_g4_i1:58-1110(+)